VAVFLFLFPHFERTFWMPTSRPTGPPRFPLGQVVITPSALEAVSLEDVSHLLARHQTGDWGDCDLDDAAANDWALTNDARLLSVYHTATNIRFWILTEADRSVTTVLLPDDY
jgi:hypothetical protein